MRFTILTALLAATAASAVRIPESEPDGIYMLDFGSGAVARRGGSYTLIEEFNKTAAAQKRDGYTLLEAFEKQSAADDEEHKRALDDPQTSCLPNTKLDGVNYQQATSLFKTRANAGDKIPGGKGIASKYGSVVVYACSWRGDNPTSAAELDDSMAKIDSDCHTLQAGACGMEPWGKNYGRDNIANQVCWGHGLS
ncbi:hypothetical protein F5Y11DRAFT_309140 [Daldinia sp. FL1419]|nr:hypothetical protein F5Y11DRAFT_309140 [Daldinia sp. FL1419]